MASRRSRIAAAPSQLPLKRIALTSQRERGWVAAERSGSPVLSRRHPLTVEGEDLGTIDVAFACGDKTGEYLVHYTESRRATDADAAAQPLKSVELRLANKVIPLALGPSRAAPDGGEVLASASGRVTASMLHNFASAGLRSIVIETASDNGDGAVIRVGNTGAAANLMPFLASCTQLPGRAEHAGLQATGGQ